MQLTGPSKVVLLLLFLTIGVLNAEITQKTKLCGDPKCSEILFKAEITRDHNTSHSQFLSYNSGEIVSVLAIKRTDYLIEGMFGQDAKRRGMIYLAHINIDIYKNFLYKSLEANKTFYKISAEESGQEPLPLIETIYAVPDLLNEYNKVASEAAKAKGLPAPKVVTSEDFGIRKELNGPGLSQGGQERLRNEHLQSVTSVPQETSGQSSERAGSVGTNSQNIETTGHSNVPVGTVTPSHDHTQSAQLPVAPSSASEVPNSPTVPPVPANVQNQPSASNSINANPSDANNNFRDAVTPEDVAVQPVKVEAPPQAAINQLSEQTPPSGASIQSPEQKSPPVATHSHVQTPPSGASIQSPEQKLPLVATHSHVQTPPPVASIQSPGQTPPPAATHSPVQTAPLGTNIQLPEQKSSPVSSSHPSEQTPPPVQKSVDQQSFKNDEALSQPPTAQKLFDPLNEKVANEQASKEDAKNVNLSNHSSGLTENIVGENIPVYLTTPPIVSPQPHVVSAVSDAPSANPSAQIDSTLLKVGTIVSSLSADKLSNDNSYVNTTPPSTVTSTGANLPNRSETTVPTGQSTIEQNSSFLENNESHSDAVTVSNITPSPSLSQSSIVEKSKEEAFINPTMSAPSPVGLETASFVTPLPQNLGTGSQAPSTLVTTTSIYSTSVSSLPFETATTASYPSVYSAIYPSVTLSPPGESSSVQSANLENIPSFSDPSSIATQDSQSDFTTMSSVDYTMPSRSDRILYPSSTITTPLPAVKSENLEVQSKGFDVVDKDGLGYCVKGSCGDVIGESSALKEAKVENKSVNEMFRKISTVFMLSTGHLDLMKLFFFGTACILLFTHLLLIVFCSDGERKYLESRMLHDALSAVRARDQRIKSLRQEAENTQEMNSSSNLQKIENLELEIKGKSDELEKYKSRLAFLTEEFDSVKVETEQAQKLLENEMEKNKKLLNKLKQSEETKQMLNGQLAEMQSNMENARGRNERLEKELADKNSLMLLQSSKIETESAEIRSLREQLKAALEEKVLLSKRVDDLQLENAQLSELYDEMFKSTNAMRSSLELNQAQPTGEHGAHESGGSGGWSDIGDFDIDALEERKETVSQVGAPNHEGKGSSTDALSNQSSIVEVARLRGQLERAKLRLQEEGNAREDLQRRLDLAESEAARCRKEVESKEAERIDTNIQCKKMLTMVEEKDTKIQRFDEIIERLREEKSELQVEIRNLEEQKLHLDTKLNELEQELKRLTTDYDRLKKRHFHELRECRQENLVLQQRLNARQNTGADSLLNDSGNLLNLSGNSSDRDALSPKNLLTGLIVPPLWSDGDTDIFSAAESSRMDIGAARSRQMPLDGVGGTSKTLRPRHRENRDISPESYSMRYKKEGRRMRSRSHGRASTHVPGGMPFYGTYETSLGRRDCKSGNNLHYSSGGSNGGLSPPPLPLLSGIPPHDVGIKKPTASTRPKSVLEQLSKHQN